MEINEIFKLADLFYKMSARGRRRSAKKNQRRQQAQQPTRQLQQPSRQPAIKQPQQPERLPQKPAPQLQLDASLIIENALYDLFGNPPMVLVNAVSEAVYNKGGSCNLIVSNVSGSPIIKFESYNNPILANELNNKFGNQISNLLATLQAKHPTIPVNEWEFFAKGFVQLLPPQ